MTAGTDLCAYNLDDGIEGIGLPPMPCGKGLPCADHGWRGATAQQRAAAAAVAGERWPPTFIATLVRQYRFRFANEAELQRGVAEVLERHRIAFSREHVLTERDRIDFLLAGGVGIECKIAGGVKDLLRQLARYADLPEITALVVVASGHRLAGAVPMGLRGKEMVAVNVRSGVL